MLHSVVNLENLLFDGRKSMQKGNPHCFETQDILCQNARTYVFNSGKCHPRPNGILMASIGHGKVQSYTDCFVEPKCNQLETSVREMAQNVHIQK